MTDSQSMYCQTLLRKSHGAIADVKKSLQLSPNNSAATTGKGYVNSMEMNK